MNEELFDLFLDNFRFSENNISNWHQIDDFRIIVEDNEGYFYLYDSILNYTRVSKDINELLRISVKDKVSWLDRFSREFYREVFKRGYTQEELSLYSGVSSGSISSYTKGEKIPSIYSLLKMLTVMDCSKKDLMNILCVNVNADNKNIFESDINDKEDWIFEFSIRLLRLLRKYKITRHEFSEIIDVSPMTVCKYVKGEIIPSSYVIYRIAKELNLTIEDIEYLLLLE